MSSDKLILYFSKENKVAFSLEQLKAAGGLIHFGAEFEDALVVSTTLDYLKVKKKEIRGKTPAIQIYNVNPSSSSMEEELAEPRSGPSSPSFAEILRFTPTDEGMIPNDIGMEDQLVAPAQDFLTRPVLTKSQRKNRKVRLKKKLAKEGNMRK